ncbi:multidrug resistance-associated ABC transporter [Pholiota molesta]|nr:multidrug resistance-associated ABC transporter [Pholiota molesta]
MMIVSLASTKYRSLGDGYSILTLLLVIGVYAYRDLYPLTAFGGRPVDADEGKTLWVKISILSMIAVIIPLFTPRRYVPVDPKVAHLSYAQLPPLADDDSSSYQTSYTIPDGTYRHLFFGLLYHFRRDYVALCTAMSLSCLSEFIAPIGIKKTLEYLETGGVGATTRPWVWISYLFIGPLLQSIAEHANAFFQYIIRVRLQAILTQFVFEHSLRIRLKAETSGDAPEDKPIIPVTKPVDSTEGENAQADTETIVVDSSETAETSTQGTQANVEVETGSTQKTRSAENLIGKINNLVTTDLDNIIEGVDFVSLGLRIPLQVILCLIFLYNILGWSVFVGFIAIMASSPLLGYIAKKIQEVQVTKMQLTDARVQKIAEAVNVLRMVKLFGWETKMTQRIDQSRQQELKWLWKLKVFSSSPASTIFSSMSGFGILINQTNRLNWQIGLIIEAKVSLDRVTNFIRDAELLDHFRIEKKARLLPSVINEEHHSQEIGFRKATFAWSVEDEDGSLTPSNRRFRLQVADELLFKHNCINLIIGPTGSGKTSMLMALLGEMHFIPSSGESWFNLPRDHGVAYATQESWVQNTTIRDNILFGAAYNEERYQKVIRQCALEADLELFEAGDQTEVGERGLTLRQARVTLARAIYSPAKIILLDDVLAALDVHTSSWIVEQCFCGDLVKDRTILLVTHNVALVGPVAQFVVSIGLDELEHDKESSKKDGKQPPPEAAADGKLVLAEELAEGHITWKSMRLLLSGFGGSHTIPIVILGIVATQLASIGRTKFLAVWGSQYETHDPSEVSLFFYLTTLCGIIIGTCLFAITNLYYNYRSISASRIIHAKLVESVFGSTLRWLDETPTARITARCTQDIRTVDGPIVQSLIWVIDRVCGALMLLFVITLLTPVFLLPDNARSPMLAHFSAAMHGLVSIRAYAAQQSFKSELYDRIDHYSRCARISWNLNRWVGFRIDILGAVFTTALAAYLVYGGTTNAANTGFSLNLATSFALERIQAYIDIDHDPRPTESGKPPASWPTSGDLRVENLNATGPKVLHNISFTISSGERIGIVGRTGSGSSLTLALLRCIPTEGTIYYDGVPISQLNLDALRSNITIIPQTPELLSEEAPITLDTQIAGGGGNLSVGQRQIIALARAIVRGSKLLILDEDYKTDAVIQRTLRTEIGRDVTAQTIMDADKIMVLDSGKLVEFDTPQNLLGKEKGLLRTLIESSKDKQALYEMAAGA